MRAVNPLMLIAATVAMLASLPVRAPAGTPPAASANALTVADAWVRATPGVDVAAAYMTLHNRGASELVVIAVRTPLAREAMIHESRIERGKSTMRLRERVAVAPGASVALAPGGLHVMLRGLAHPLAVGEVVGLELLLAGGGSVAVSARVRPLNAA